MSRTVPSPNLSPGKAAKGSKAACEAAGWVFQPLPNLTAAKGLPRRWGNRGVMVIPPSGSGIDPLEHGGMGRAVAWAVEQSARLAEAPPPTAIAGMDGIRMLLGLALASGEICAGDDEVPARPDAVLLALCTDVLIGVRRQQELHGPFDGGKDPALLAWSASHDVAKEAANQLPVHHATTREGLLAKARAVLVGLDQVSVTTTIKLDLARSVLVDLIHLVPTFDAAAAPHAPRDAAASRPPRDGEPA